MRPRRRPTHTSAEVAVASCGVAAFAGDFDDIPEDNPPSQPLPAEDRLWRHPSELGSISTSLPLDPITVRRRWLASQPSKASAWTAGLVGALLATGLVALGTHLASAITTRGNASATAGKPSSPTLTSLPESINSGSFRLAVGSELAARIATVGQAVVYMDVSHGTTEVQCLGVGIRADGMLLAPAADVAGATSIMVMLPDGSYYVGEVVASDVSARAASSGLALVHINGVSDLPVAPLETTQSTTASTLAVALTSRGGSTIAVGSVHAAPGTTTAGDPVLVDPMTTDIETSSAPPGSLLVGADGTVIGMVTGSSSGKVVATPAWIASMVADKLLAGGAVKHGWLGIEGATTSGPPGGVRVTLVAGSSAAHEAGLRSGDTITSVDGHRVTTMAELQGRLYFVRPGARVTVGVMRAGRALKVIAALDDQQMK
jgi:S1-C subfamily serine protease